MGHGHRRGSGDALTGDAGAAVYQLLGFPGTGKRTIAAEIVRQLEDAGRPAALLDNHATANLIWSLVPANRRFEPAVMATINELRATIVRAARELSTPDHSFVFTNFVSANQPRNLLDPHRELARAHGIPMIAVRLCCDRDEVLRRVATPEREALFKLVDVDIARRIMDAGETLPEWPELVELDITGMSVADAAAAVIAMASTRERRGDGATTT